MLFYVVLATLLHSIHASNHTITVVTVVSPSRRPLWIILTTCSVVSIVFLLFVCCKVSPLELKKRKARFVQVV